MISNEFTKNKQVLKFVEESANLCKPDKVVWITGDEAQLEELRQEALKTGELIKLNGPLLQHQRPPADRFPYGLRAGASRPGRRLLPGRVHGHRPL